VSSDSTTREGGVCAGIFRDSDPPGGVAPDGGREDRAANDSCMWTCCGKERTRREWEALFAEVGMKIARVVMPETGFLGVYGGVVVGAGALVHGRAHDKGVLTRFLWVFPLTPLYRSLHSCGLSCRSRPLLLAVC
jgi:hypothetical protein